MNKSRSLDEESLEPCLPAWRRVMARLTGTGLIADDLYLLAHDDVTGKPFLQARALGVGLAGGLLAELAIQDAIRVQADRIALLGLGKQADGLARSFASVTCIQYGTG